MSITRVTCSLVVALQLAGCGGDEAQPAERTQTATVNVFSDSFFRLMPSNETDPVFTERKGANDLAIWVNEADPARSLVIGTDTDTGLGVFGLDGHRVQLFTRGMPYNVDIRNNVTSRSGNLDLGAFSDLENNTVGWFSINTDGISFVSATSTPMKPHGICLGRSGEQLLAIVTYKPGLVEMYQADFNNGSVEMSLLASHRLLTRIESCVYDDRRDILYVSEENVGVWRFENSGGQYLQNATLIDSVDGSGVLKPDIEGVAIFRGEHEYLIVGSQGDDSFAIYDLAPPNPFRGHFKVAESLTGIDRVEHSDGIEAVAIPLPGYPHGLIVVQDDDNEKENQNYKLIDADFREMSIPR